MLVLCCCRRAFSSYGERGLISSCGEQASHHGSFSGGRAQTLVWDLQSACGLSPCAAQAYLLHNTWNLPRPGIELVSPALQGGLLTTGPLAAATAAKSLQSCPTLCDPHRRQPTRLPHPWDSPGKNTGVGCHFLLQCMKVECEREIPQSCLTPSDPMDCSPPGSSIHGIFQARVLE